MPDWKLVKAYCSGRITKEEYSAAYLRGLEENLDHGSEWLSSLTADEDIILLCHETQGEFCHRRLVVEVVRKHRPDIPVDLY